MLLLRPEYQGYESVSSMQRQKISLHIILTQPCQKSNFFRCQIPGNLLKVTLNRFKSAKLIDCGESGAVQTLHL
jgi:hypothetical protein